MTLTTHLHDSLIDPPSGSLERTVIMRIGVGVLQRRIATTRVANQIVAGKSEIRKQNPKPFLWIPRSVESIFDTF